MPKTLVVLGFAVVALMAVSTMAHAQGVMFVKNNNVGIGEANPTVPLHINVVGDDFAGMGPDPFNAAGQGFNFGYTAAAGFDGGFFNTRSGGLTNMNIATANTVRIRVDGASGNISIGANVLADVAVHPLQHFDTGAHLSAAGVWTNASSRALKQDITALSADDAMSALRALSPVTYEYMAEPGEGYVGFIAEDVPDLVATPDRKSLASMDVVAVLTKVVQEQQSTIEELSQRLAELEDR